MAAAPLPSLLSCPQLQKRSHASLNSSPSQLPALSSKTEKWNTEKPKGGILHLKRKTSWRPLCIGGSAEPSESSPSHMIHEFYSCITDESRSTSELEKFISEDCFLEDLAFPEPFKGKEAVHRFLKQLREAMGKHITFKIERVYEGKHSTAEGEYPTIGVLWHLDWNGSQIPFTKGCTFYECSKTDDGLLIKQARVFEESPIKPGEFVLELLKIISSIFDKFPGFARMFLQRPHTLMIFIMKAYKLFVEPLILPIVVYYSHLWTYAARILSFLLKLALNILKIFS